MEENIIYDNGLEFAICSEQDGKEYALLVGADDFSIPMGDASFTTRLQPATIC